MQEREERDGGSLGGEDLLEEIGRKKQLLDQNGTVNRLRTIDMILKDIRNSKLGRISWQSAGE